MGNRTFAIIGVVGRTFRKQETLTGKEQDLLQVAFKVGEVITQNGHAVLTGGHHERSEKSVKYCALKGAISKASEASPARMIGILPKSISDALGPSAGEKPITICSVRGERVRWLYAHTMMKSEDRDFITGQTADALIALEGKSGTPREVAAALDAGRPVVFLNSLNVLKPRVCQILTKVAFPSSAIEADSPEAALKAALDAICWDTPGRRLDGRCPFHTEEFERGLQQFEHPSDDC